MLNATRNGPKIITWSYPINWLSGIRDDNIWLLLIKYKDAINGDIDIYIIATVVY
jgi:hypothetical protein